MARTFRWHVLALVLSIASFAAFAVPSASFAACPPGQAVCELDNPLVSKTTGKEIKTVPELIGGVVRIFTGVSGSFALLMFVYGGYMWIFSGGSEERITKGKAAMTWATIGLAIIFGAYALVTQVFKFL